MNLTSEGIIEFSLHSRLWQLVGDAPLLFHTAFLGWAVDLEQCEKALKYFSLFVWKSLEHPSLLRFSFQPPHEPNTSLQTVKFSKRRKMFGTGDMCKEINKIRAGEREGTPCDQLGPKNWRLSNAGIMPYTSAVSRAPKPSSQDQCGGHLKPLCQLT